MQEGRSQGYLLSGKVRRLFGISEPIVKSQTGKALQIFFFFWCLCTKIHLIWYISGQILKSGVYIKELTRKQMIQKWKKLIGSIILFGVYKPNMKMFFTVMEERWLSFNKILSHQKLQRYNFAEFWAEEWLDLNYVFKGWLQPPCWEYTAGKHAGRETW